MNEKRKTPSEAISVKAREQEAKGLLEEALQRHGPRGQAALVEAAQ